MEINVIFNADSNQFETLIDGYLALLEFKIDEEVINLHHTEVPKQLGGMGVGSRLVKAALDYAERQNMKVDPQCPFVRTYIEKHPEYQPLLID